MRRIASAALLHSFDSVDAQRQFVNRRDGCLAVAELIRAAIASGAAASCVKIDIKNAYTIERKVFLQEAEK